MVNLLNKEEVYAIIGSAMGVYNQLGPGFLEAVYQEVLEIELSEHGIPHRPQAELPVSYKGRTLKKFYVADFLAFDAIVVEIKAQDCLTSHDEAQVINELKATSFEVGVLINFGAKSKLEWKRLILTKKSTVKPLTGGKN